MAKYFHSKHFSLEEARTQLTSIHAAASRMIELKRSLDLMGWDIYRHRYFGGRGPNGDGTFPKEMEALVEIVQGLDKRGVVVKGIDEGLIDFPHIRGNGEEVYLCWKIGEDDITNWHRLAEGYAGRKSIKEL